LLGYPSAATARRDSPEQFSMATLVRTQGSHEGKWIYPIDGRCFLGRHKECDIFDIFADNSNVSRFHALLELVGGRYYIEDKGSRNGTFVNGRRLTSRVPLQNGDQIGIADVELTFLEEAKSLGEPARANVSEVSFSEPAKPETPRSRLAMTSAVGPLSGYSGDKLHALVQMLKRLGRSLDIDANLKELLAGLFAIFPQARSGYVAFKNDGQDDVTPCATLFQPPELSPRVRISRVLVRHVLSKREAVLWEDQSQGSVASNSLADLQIRSLMCAPLLDGDGNPFGIVQIDTDDPMQGFTSDDLEVLVGAVSQAAVSVRFARLHEEALRRQAMERDLELARRVQLGLLPESYPDCEGFEFFAYYRAAFDVGGDYYDFIELPHDRFALVVADAAGKGVSAALMMAKLSGELKYHLSCEAPGSAFALMNDGLCAGNTGRFVTLLAVILDRHSSMLTLVNAGHPAPLRRSANGMVEAVGEKARGPALGIIPGSKYVETRITIEPGDVWLAYTDGFTEATNSRGELFGVKNLRDRLALAPGVVREASDRIVREVQTFLGNQPQSDDMCMVGWGRLTGSVERTGEFGDPALSITKRLK
jgi:serine phosphatase RsbU (regulator of sigma subunit)